MIPEAQALGPLPWPPSGFAIDSLEHYMRLTNPRLPRLTFPGRLGMAGRGLGPAGPEQAGAAGLGRRLAPSRAAGRLQPGGRCRVGEPGAPAAPPGEGGEGGEADLHPFLQTAPRPLPARTERSELSGRLVVFGRSRERGLSGPARVDPSKPGKCALGGSESAESAAPPARAGLAGLLRWRVRARPGQREVGAANCAPASCAAGMRRNAPLECAGMRRSRFQGGQVA